MHAMSKPGEDNVRCEVNLLWPSSNQNRWAQLSNQNMQREQFPTLLLVKKNQSLQPKQDYCLREHRKLIRMFF